MSKGGAESDTTTVTPWEEQQPYLQSLFQDADALKNWGSKDIGVSPYSRAAAMLGANRALIGSPVSQSAQGLATDTLQGDYLNSNPYLDETFNRGARQIESTMRGAWGHDDTMTGSSGLQQAALGTGLADFATGLYGGNYQSERARQMAAMGMAPGLANQDYTDIGQLQTAGNLDKLNAMQPIDDQWLNLQRYANTIGGNFGKTTTTPYYDNSNPLGGAASGAMLGATVGGPYGALAGAGIGLLAGGK